MKKVPFKEMARTKRLLVIAAILVSLAVVVFVIVTAVNVHSMARYAHEYDAYAAYLENYTITVAIVFGGLVVALSFIVNLYSARTIARRSEKLYRNDKMFSVIAENTDDVFMICMYDPIKVAYISENMERVLGITTKQYMEKLDILKKYMNTEDFYELLGAFQDTARERMVELEYSMTHARTREILELRTRMYPLFDKNDGKANSVIVLTQDITKDKKAQAVLQDALNVAERANEVKKDFLSRISHDLRTPINAIIGMKTIAEMSMGDDIKVRDCLSKIGDASDHLLDMVTDVLDMSRLEMGRLKLEYRVFKLDEMINRVFSIIYPRALEKNQRFSVDMRDIECDYLVGDETRIRQIVLNLLTNAVKFTQEQGIVKLIVKQYGKTLDGAYTSFIVKDNGIGIRTEFLARIFMPFEQDETIPGVKGEGTGLGLPICKSLATQMGGDIFIESVEGEGSEFRFDIWLQAVQAEDETAQYIEQEKKIYDFRGKRALVVEDNEINREIMEELLKSVGLEVETAENGAEAIEIFEKVPDRYFDLIMMDVRMPVMDGNEAVRAIRSSDKGGAQTIPIIAMTANIRPESMNDSVRSGMTAYITKPVDTQKLFATIKACIDEDV